MIIVEKLEDIPPISRPIALAIGSYDGVHLGHQYLFKELKKHGTAAVLTFSNHPAEVLHPHSAPPLIDTLDQKIRRLEINGIDLALILPFTPELSSLSYDTFLKQVHQHLPFTHLIRGEGSVLGHKGQGTQENIQALAKELNFEAIYLPTYLFEGEPVSSKKIRELINSGNFEQAFRLLGRRFDCLSDGFLSLESKKISDEVACFCTKGIAEGAISEDKNRQDRGNLFDSKKEIDH